jgi:sirohydrochlorin ferrochelatase
MRLISLIALLATLTSVQTQRTKTGLLVLAHGGSPAWNANVQDIVRTLDRDQPAEVAFGMATRGSIQAAIERLEAKGATEIVAVPLFVSSHSSIIRSTEYLLGLRKDAPPELARYAKMSHAGHGTAPAADGTTPVVTKLRIRMTKALDDHPLLGAIAADRARAISKTPAREAVVLAVHGPVLDADNDLWLNDLRTVAKSVTGYAAVDVISLRDDAPAPIRDAATESLRAAVTAHRNAGRDVLIVPILLSFGGIEEKLKSRLAGLAYRMPAQGIAPDARLIEWVRAMAR